MKMVLKNLLLLGCILSMAAKSTSAQTLGCTDFQANNYKSGATLNDGSCTYNSTSYSPIKLIDKLSDTLIETSALINIDGELWTLDDSGNPNAIYHFDKATGAVLQTIFISNATNHDWEDMTADQNNIYIGDFGNNNGNRTNLAVYKIPKLLLSKKKVDSVVAEKIIFSYADQKDFNSNNNANSFDCEAMFVWNDSLHLLTKDWINGHSKHYLLPTTPGSYNLFPIDSLDAGCLITGAAFEPLSKRIVLTGYNKTGFCYIWLLWDFTGSKIFSGNKRKIDFGFFTNTGQIEGVCFNDSSNIYITNEKNIVNNKLYAAQVGQWMNKKSTGVDYHKQNITELQVYPNPASTEIYIIYNLQKPAAVSYCIYNREGKLVSCSKKKLGGGKVVQKTDIASLSHGTYYLVVHSENANTERRVFIKEVK